MEQYKTTQRYERNEKKWETKPAKPIGGSIQQEAAKRLLADKATKTGVKMLGRDAQQIQNRVDQEKALKAEVGGR